MEARKFNERVNSQVFRGEVWLVNFGDQKGSLQSSIRPGIILQNDIGNKYSPTTIVIPLTTVIKNLNMPTHIVIDEGEGNLVEESMTLCEQPTTINKTQLIKKYGIISNYLMRKIENAVNVSLGIKSNEKFDKEYISKKIELIEKLLNVMSVTPCKDIKDIIEETIGEVKTYCDRFGIESRLYIGKYERRNINRMVV